MPDDTRIGALRWRLTLERRTDVPDFDPEETAVVDARAARVEVYGSVVPVGTAAYLAGEQSEIGAVTHRITIRWRPLIDTYHVVTRRVALPDGDTRLETYRIRRVAEWQGRQRFLVIDAELERFAP